MVTICEADQITRVKFIYTVQSHPIAVKGLFGTQKICQKSCCRSRTSTKMVLASRPLLLSKENTTGKLPTSPETMFFPDGNKHSWWPRATCQERRHWKSYDVATEVIIPDGRWYTHRERPSRHSALFSNVGFTVRNPQSSPAQFPLQRKGGRGYFGHGAPLSRCNTRTLTCIQLTPENPGAKSRPGSIHSILPFPNLV